MNAQIQTLRTTNLLSLSSSSSSSSNSLSKTSVVGHGRIFQLPVYTHHSLCKCKKQKQKHHGSSLCMRASGGDWTNPLSGLTRPKQEKMEVKCVVTVKVTLGGFFTNLDLTKPLDDFADLLGKTLLLGLVSSHLDPDTGLEKEEINAFAHKSGQEGDEVKYECNFSIPENFGPIGAVVVENEHHNEMFFKDIALQGLLEGSVHVDCQSWVHSKFDNPDRRIFFTNKSYITQQTPDGLRRLRELELENLRGNGQGERKSFERIYDYDTYNDLGDPSDPDLARPVLGGKQHPYPRRCRTGHPRTKIDSSSETRSNILYVPRDEAFSEIKQLTFSGNTLRSVLHALIPQIESQLIDPHLRFPYFTAIDSLYNEGINLPKPPNASSGFKSIIPRLVKAVASTQDELLCFETPELVDRDKFAWFRDEEFARQMLAGLNPLSIQLVTEWPLKSKLDPEIYGPPESLITSELVEKEIKGIMTIQEALEQTRLFILDYHDFFLPYVHKVRELGRTSLYGSRTLLFLNEGTLRPLAIELTRPKNGDKPQWRQVFTPNYHSTGCWLWRLAKAHVSAHDAGFHQLVAHWLRTHCCTEPYIIATNRQLSAMHPIYRLLHPHFRYTMEINALARQSLINAGGIIESSFALGKYSMEISSAAYDQLWQFNTESLPGDLIKRGMAVEDPTAKHGLKLKIEDYPYAVDGLVLWDAIKQWVTDYVNHYYPDAAMIESDTELQRFWREVQTKGHTDKKDESWWPNLKTQADLVQIVTTIIWVTSGHHAAVNFGQYHFGGYFPNRPTLARRNMPTEDTTEEEFHEFLKKPETTLLRTFPSQVQATKVMAILDVLSGHSPDEEYIAEKPEPSWEEDPVIKAAFERFNARIKELEGIIDERNVDLKLKNRTGAGVVPYELLKPFSPPGVTGMGVPNSISI